MPYTPGQVSEMLDIPPSSLRRLSREFEGFLSKSKGRHNRYTEQDIVILRQVREMTAQGKTIEFVKQHLTISQPPPPKDNDSLNLVPSIAGELSRMDDNYRSVMRELDSLKEGRQVDQERLQRLEKIAEWSRLPWWKKLFIKPPV